MLREGDVLAGKYRIERQLGEGGMGYVVAAIHEQLQQRVAVKFLAEAHAKNPEAAARFLREARAAVRVQSEHVARVLDVAELEDGSPYMVMEFLLGNDLSEELARAGVFPPEVAVDFILQACEAVAEAHSIGLVHRDLKPANLFVTRRADGSPLVKVLDFGISKALSAGTESATLTTAQAILGSPAYMSPEQARKPRGVDMRTDIWSLGIILYEFLTGTVPFTGDTILSVIAAAFSEKPPSVRELRPELPEGIDVVVDRCLEKSPDDRYQTVAELAEALAPFAQPHSLPSVSRIRGTVLRWSSSPPPISSGRSVPPASREPRVRPSDKPPAGPVATHDLDTLALFEQPAQEAGVLPKSETLTDWGTSSARPGRSRRRAVIAGVAVVVVLTLLSWRLLSERDIASRETPEQRPAASLLPPTEPPAASPGEPGTSTRAPLVVAPAPVLSLEANPVLPSAVPSLSARRSKASVPPAAKPAKSPVSSPAQPVNPLDGRL